MPTAKPMKRFIASIDQGTTSTRCLYFNVDTLNFEGAHQIEHKQITPHPGWLEHDAEEIYKNSVLCMNEGYKKLVAAHAAEAESVQVLAVGITNQRETTVAWSRATGKPLCNAIVWSDVRTQDVVAKIIKTKANGDAAFLQKQCGLPISTYFSALKMVWMIENVPAVKAARDSGDLMFGTIDAWLVYRLSGGKVHATDCTNASRTMLLDLATLDYADNLCDFFGVPRSALPTVKSNADDFGTVTCDLIAPALRGLPIAGCVGDQQGSLVGNMCFEKGQAKNTYGTGCFLLANIGEAPQASKHGLVTTVGFRLGSSAPTNYALEGSIGGAGATTQWMRDKLGFFSKPAEATKLASSVNDTAGVVFVPAFGGLLAPYWRPDARGAIVGLTYRATKAHIVRAHLEGIAMMVSQIVEGVTNDTGVAFNGLKVDGGMTNNTAMMQIQADLLNLSVSVPTMPESTALGAALCAGIGIGHWTSTDEIVALSKENHSVKRVYSSAISAQERKERRALWERGVKRSLDWSTSNL